MSKECNRHIDTKHGGFGLVDDLYMSYSGNQLTSVCDKATHPAYAGATDFYTDSKTKSYALRYNASGSLVSDAGRKIAYIEYDNNNNPILITFTDGSETEYVYSATGEKLRVTYITAKPNVVTRKVGVKPSSRLSGAYWYGYETVDYLLGGSLTLRNGRIDQYQFEEGYCQAEECASNKTKDKFTFCYYDQDHLGNIRQVREANGSKGEVIQTNNYYPFGAEFCDNGAKNYTQKHKYNGKEFDNMHGLNSYDYGARQYNPVTARWDRVDPLCEKYYGTSPYVYCVNNPMMYVDPDGRQPGDIYNNNGEHIGNDGINDSKVYLYKTNASTQLSQLESYNLTHGQSSNVDNITKKTGMTNEELNLRATLSTLKQAEAGTANKPLDYNSWNHGDVFTNKSFKEDPKAYSEHPGMKNKSTAAGAYQFLMRFYPKGDFSPSSQDRNAIKLMNSPSYKAAIKGDILSFKKEANNTWTSLRHMSSPEILKEFNSNRAKELMGTSKIASSIGSLINVR